MIEIGKHSECAVFGILGCCRNTVSFDGFGVPENTFKGAIIHGAQRGDMQASHSTLAQQLREHLVKVLEHKRSNTIELPTDLTRQETYWVINDGLGSVFPGYPFKIQYHPENEDA